LLEYFTKLVSKLRDVRDFLDSLQDPDLIMRVERLQMSRNEDVSRNAVRLVEVIMCPEDFDDDDDEGDGLASQSNDTVEVDDDMQDDM
jgi:hypothetical protein